MFPNERCAGLGGHCNHWGLTDAQHALTHAIARHVDAVADLDVTIDLEDHP